MAGLVAVCAAGAMLSSAASTASAISAVPSASTPSAPIGAPRQDAASVSSATLPNGDRVEYQGASVARTYNVVGPDGRTVPFTKFDAGNGHVYVIPASALFKAQSLDIAQYDVPQLSPPAGSAATQATPYFPMHIVQINANDLTGAPAQSAVSFLLDLDSVQKFVTAIPDIGGVARVAVPVGNYALYTGFTDYDASGTAIGEHLVLQENLAVPSTGGTVTATADERTASTLVTAATPRPAKAAAVNLSLIRTDATGIPVVIQAYAQGNVYVSPEAAPTVGKLSYQVTWDGENPTASSAPYRYDLAFPPTDSVPANETFPVPPSGLATLHYTLDTDASNTSHTALYQMGPVNRQVGGLIPEYVVPAPERLTDYVTAPLPTGFTWIQNYQPEPTNTSDYVSLPLQAGNVPDFTAGHDYWRTWGHGPLAPQVGQFAGANSCFDCASSTSMGIDFNGDAEDSEPQTPAWYTVPPRHDNPVTEHFTVYQDGNQIYDQPSTTAAMLSNVPQQTGIYRAVFDVDATADRSVSQSTKTHTDLTFVYHPAGDPNSVLPNDDYCYASNGASAPCQILPMLNLNYQLNTDGANTSHGASVLDLTVGHLSYDGKGTRAPAASAKVEISLDGGATWTKAPTIPTIRDHYLAVWPNRGAKGSTPWLRVTATDTIGGSITQTIANAYTVG